MLFRKLRTNVRYKGTEGRCWAAFTMKMTAILQYCQRILALPAKQRPPETAGNMSHLQTVSSLGAKRFPRINMNQDVQDSQELPVALSLDSKSANQIRKPYNKSACESVLVGSVPTNNAAKQTVLPLSEDPLPITNSACRLNWLLIAFKSPFMIETELCPSLWCRTDVFLYLKRLNPSSN